ncbi:unnamed protein product, partial [Gongylonema pulchrum]|uniref:Uncharacterized protein n=1 Tax=Gongylonema pulchrum TaxID=637853 RepID=A0A183EEK0_9BILA
MDDHQACTSMDVSDPSPLLPPTAAAAAAAGGKEDPRGASEIEWRFSQVKGNIEAEEGAGRFVHGQRSTEYNVYSTFQSHEPEFDYLKSLEIEEKINQIKWLKRKNAANFILSTN